jgi:hypothetical protein
MPARPLPSRGPHRLSLSAAAQERLKTAASGNGLKETETCNMPRAPCARTRNRKSLPPEVIAGVGAAAEGAKSGTVEAALHPRARGRS